VDVDKNELRRKWSIMERSKDEEYLSELRSLDPDGCGVLIVCPDCGASSWIRLSEKRYARNPISISCPAACGAHYQIASFSPVPTSKSNLDSFDIESTCGRDGAEFAVNGAVFRCPVCSIENPREVMRNLSNRIRAKCSGETLREELIRMLGEVVGTFDGVMRRSNAIAVRNHEKMNETSHPKVSSFQNVSVARDKLLPGFDMASAVNDWPTFTRSFQKRHLFAHSLGVVDADYLKKTGDQSAILGKQVPLSSAEIVALAEGAESIVRKYFGYYLS
jgi:hypothetical protein